MGNYDFEEELSDPDETLKDELQEISLACMPTRCSDTPNPSRNPSPNPNAQEEDDDDDDDDDDLKLVRRIKEDFGLPLSLKPLFSLPPFSDDDDDDDDDVDYETLRAIMARFSQYPTAPFSNADEVKRKNSVDESPLTNPSESFDVRLEEHASTDNMHIPSCDISSSSFPAAAQTFLEAIKRNRSCQKFLRTKMLHVEARMEQLKEVLKRVKTLRDFQIQCKKKIGRALSQKQDARVHLILPPSKLKPDTKGCEKNVSTVGPLGNSHVGVYKTALKAFPISFHRQKWSKDESQLLQSEIIKQFQERLFQKSVDIASVLEEPGCEIGVDSMISSITNIPITPDIIQEFSGNVDWNRLASGLPRRTGAECEARWLNHENCLINQKEWTSEEDKHLLLLIQNIGLHSWSCIAEKLGTNRTPFQCLTRFQRSLNASILKRDWTEDEDAQLRSAVETFGGSNWQAVASVIEGRTGTQCSQRWNKTLLPARERVGKWSIDEDKRLRVAATLFGYKSWNRIANFVPGRTQAQCRERWKNVLDPSLNLGKWTEEEDMKLKAAIAEYGYCWSKVAACVPSRTDSQCRRRWKRLFPNEVPLLKAARMKQKAALIANFVDRESYRPALGVDDFLPLPIADSTNVIGNELVSQSQNKLRKCRKANPNRESVSSCDLKVAVSKKRKRSNSLTVDNNRDSDDAHNDNGCNSIEYKMRSSSRSGSKRKKASGNINISSEQKKSRNMPMRTKSRTQRDDVIKTPLTSDCSVSQTTGIHDTNVNTSTLVHSSIENDAVVTHVENSNVVSMERKKRPCRKKPKSSISENAITENSYELELRTRGGNEADFVDATGTTKRRKRSKSQTDNSLEWQDMPLATLFSKAVNRKRGRISIVRPPIRFTYVRRNKKGTLDSTT